MMVTRELGATLLLGSACIIALIEMGIKYPFLGYMERASRLKTFYSSRLFSSGCVHLQSAYWKDRCQSAKSQRGIPKLNQYIKAFTRA